MAKAAESGKTAILAEQRAWLTYRDASCEVYMDDDAFGQNGRYLFFPTCRAETIITRTKALTDMIQTIDPP